MLKPKQFLIEVKDPAGETLCQAFAQTIRVVKFTRLKPGIVTACVKDMSGGSSCISVDIYPAPAVQVAKLAVDLKPPAPAQQAERLYLVDKARLAIPEQARREFDECIKDRRRGNAAEGMKHLERALTIHPRYAEALTNLGTACHFAGDYSRALRFFAKATEVAPEMFAGWLNLGVTLLVTGDLLGALQAEIRALSLHPDDPFVVYQVGLCHHRLGEFDAAKRYLNRVIELDPCSTAYPHVPLARIALAENRPDEAVRLVREVSRLHPHAPQPPALKELMSQLAGMLRQ